jgi:hypothetical protein
LKNPKDGWRNFFIISIIIYFIGGLGFIIFATTNMLSWAKITANSKNLDNQTQINQKNRVYDISETRF